MIKKFITGKSAVFIDASNILYSQKTLGWKIDYIKLKKYLENQSPVISFNYYTGKIGTFEKQSKFINKLESVGYTVISKEKNL